MNFTDIPLKKSLERIRMCLVCQWRSQYDNLVVLRKYFCVHKVQKQSNSKEMNNDHDLKFAQHNQIDRLASPLLLVLHIKVCLNHAMIERFVTIAFCFGIGKFVKVFKVL